MLYIDTNNERPSKGSKDNKIKQLGYWISNQQNNYKNKEKIMLNEEIYNKWTVFINKYKKYFQSNEDLWLETFNQIIQYIDENNKRPSKHDVNKQIKHLGIWIQHQQNNYNKKEKIMLNKEICNKWTEFTNDDKYKKYFQSNEEIWLDSLNQVTQFIDNNSKRPSCHDKNKQVRTLGTWTNTQQINYNKKKETMLNGKIYNKWNEFINNNKYKKYFQSNKNLWLELFNKVIQYIDENNKRPSCHNKDKQIKQLGSWIGTQKINYKKKKEIMLNEEIYNIWTEFINDIKYKKYFNNVV